jgi:hypothetical protein
MNYFVVYSDKKYVKEAENLFGFLEKHSKYQIIYVTLDFYYTSSFANVIPVTYNTQAVINSKTESEPDYLGRDRPVPFLFIKAAVCQFVIKLFENANFCYLDSDIIPLKNIDSLFDKFDLLENYPLFALHSWDYLIWNNMGVDKNHEKNLFDYLGYDSALRHDGRYVQSCVFLFNKKCQEFLKEWALVCNDERVAHNYKKYAPAHDESIANVLLWGNKYYKDLGTIHIDIPLSKGKCQDLTEFFNLIKNHDHQHAGNHAHRGRPQDQFYYDEFTRIPSKSNFDDIKCFHGKLNEKNTNSLQQYFNET